MVLGDVRTQKARKPHACYWCGEAIERGTDYDSWAWADDGTVTTTRVHRECRVAWDFAVHEIDRFYYSEEVSMGDHRRGCCCAHLRKTDPCDCEMAAASAKENARLAGASEAAAKGGDDD